jgi:hypothetical protein
MRAVALAACFVIASCGFPSNEAYHEFGPVYWNSENRQLILGGEPYLVPDSVPAVGLRSGDEVDLYWEPQGDQKVVTRLSITKRRFLFGI